MVSHRFRITVSAGETMAASLDRVVTASSVSAERYGIAQSERVAPSADDDVVIAATDMISDCQRIANHDASGNPYEPKSVVPANGMTKKSESIAYECFRSSID
jgi:hypothetical protein